MEQGANQTRRKSASAQPPGRSSNFSSPFSRFSRRSEDGRRESQGRMSGGTTVCELGAGGGGEIGEDVYEFFAARSSRRRHSSSLKKLRDKKARKLTPKGKAPMTLEERMAEILARTRSATGTAPVSIAGSGGGGLGGSGEGETTSPTGGAGAPAGDGSGTFSDFAKSLREFQGGLDLSAATSDGAISETREGGPRESEMSDSLVIDETDMEVGCYARPREALQRSREGLGAAAVASTSARSRSSPTIGADLTETLPRVEIPSTLVMRSEGSDDCTRVRVASGGDGKGLVTDAGRKRTGSEGGEAGSDTCYEDDGFEAEIEEEDSKEKGAEEEVEGVGGEARKVRSRGGTEDNGDVDVDSGGGGGCDGANARESSAPLRFEDAVTNRSIGDGVDDRGDGGGGEGEGTEDFPPGVEASIVLATSPRYLLGNVTVSGGVIPTSPGGRSASSLPPAPPDSPSPSPSPLPLPSCSPLPAPCVAVAAAAVAAAEAAEVAEVAEVAAAKDNQSTDGRAREIDRTGTGRRSSGGSFSESTSALGTEGACGLESSPPSPPPSPPPPPPRHPPPDEGGRRGRCDSAVEGASVGPVFHEVRGDATFILRRDQNQRDRSGAALDVTGGWSDGHRRSMAPVPGRGTAAAPAAAPLPAPGAFLVLSEGCIDDGGGRSSAGTHSRRSDGSPPPVSSSSRGGRGDGGGVQSTRDRRRQHRGQRVDALQDKGKIADGHAASSGLSWDDVVPGSSPALTGLEEQRSTLNPLGGGSAEARCRASSSRRYPCSGRGRRGSGGSSSTGVGFDERERSRSFADDLDTGAAERDQGSSRKDRARDENWQGFGHTGSAAAMDDVQGPADLSSVVLMSSLSSTPGKRRSDSGRWAAGRDQVSTGRADVAVDGPSAANCWENTTFTPQAERGFQDDAEIAMRAQVKPSAERRRRQSPIAAAVARDGEDSSRMQQQLQLHLEADRRREETERELEKARAEIYALQVR